jgi:hypothetical protein
MSKQLDATAVCGHCGHRFPTKVYRTLWIEDPEHRKSVLEDRVNNITCPRCGTINATDLALLCSNAELGFALWYEPLPDPVIDLDIAGFVRHLGPTHYLAKAPRIHDWKQFKKSLLEMEEDRLREVKGSCGRKKEAWHQSGSSAQSTYKRLWDWFTKYRRSNHGQSQAPERSYAIYLDDKPSSLARQIGQVAVKVLKEASESPKCPLQGRRDWQLLKKWLGCGNGELTDADLQKIGIAWQSYYATFPAPTKQLEDAFAYHRKAAAEECLQIVSIPDEVRRVFDRMLGANARL